MTDSQPPVPPADGETPPPVPPVPSADGVTPPPPAAPTAPPAAPTPPPAQPAYPAYGQPAQGYYAPPTNTLAIVAMILSLVGLLTGITAIVGAILGHVAMGQIKRTGENGRGFALTAIIVGWVLTGLGVLAIIGTIIFAVWAASMGAAYSTYGY